jgi:hypothetical protein
MTIHPIAPLNREGLDEIAEALLKDEKLPTSGEVDHPERYILLPEQTRLGTFSYPAMAVYMHRLPLTQVTQQAAQNLGITIAETAEEQDKTKYVGSMQWEQALKLNLLSGHTTLNPRQFIDFKHLLEDGIDSRVKVYTANGTELPKELLSIVHNEIFEVKEPYRAEWLDADFKEINKVLHINSNHILDNGNLKPQITEPLEDYLRKDCRIDTRSINRQGLPTRKSSKGISYYHPKTGSVAGFYADSSRADLGCDWGPRYSGAELAVRPAKILV